MTVRRKEKQDENTGYNVCREDEKARGAIFRSLKIVDIKLSRCDVHVIYESHYARRCLQLAVEITKQIGNINEMYEYARARAREKLYVNYFLLQDILRARKAPLILPAL